MTRKQCTLFAGDAQGGPRVLTVKICALASSIEQSRKSLPASGDYVIKVSGGRPTEVMSLANESRFPSTSYLERIDSNLGIKFNGKILHGVAVYISMYVQRSRHHQVTSKYKGTKV